MVTSVRQLAEIPGKVLHSENVPYTNHVPAVCLLHFNSFNIYDICLKVTVLTTWLRFKTSKANVEVTCNAVYSQGVGTAALERVAYPIKGHYMRVTKHCTARPIPHLHEYMGLLGGVGGQ